MKKYSFILLAAASLLFNACTQSSEITPTQEPAIEIAASTETPTPTVVPTVEITPTPDQKQYVNEEFGFSFNFPSNWYGPEEYIADPILRVEIGTDVVYPYGTDRTDQVYEDVNSYYILIQYYQNTQNTFWEDTYSQLEQLQDGESNSGVRGKIIRVRSVNFGNFSGYEYISTLSETAQTEYFYSRSILLVDEQSNVLTLMGTPNNVNIPENSDWRTVYQQIDEEYAATFHEVFDSITIVE